MPLAAKAEVISDLEAFALTVSLDKISLINDFESGPE